MSTTHRERISPVQQNSSNGRAGKRKRGATWFALLSVVAASVALAVGGHVTGADAPACQRWVATSGSNSAAGSQTQPWATLQHAVDAVPATGCVINVQPGTYAGVEIERRYSAETILRSVTPYRAAIKSSGMAVAVDGASRVTIEGFEIAQAGTTGNNVLVNVEDGDGYESTYVTLRNNVIHDSYDDDLLKVRSGARFVTIEGNVLYNPASNEQHMDINGVQDITIQDNLLFNDYAGSGRANPGDTKAYIVVKDSSGTGELGSRRVAIRRNVFMNWQGGNEPFFQIGNDGKEYHEAIGVQIENNLLLGNSPILTNAALGVAGAKDVFFVNNTVVGNLPSKQYAMRIVRKGANPANQNIVLANNIYSDHTGSMDELLGGDAPTGVTLRGNLYWNNGQAIDGGTVALTSDAQRVTADPRLDQNHAGVVLPRWGGSAFSSGSTTIRQEFIRIAQRYSATASGSAAIDKADPSRAPANDILGRSRGGSPDVGAWEFGATGATTSPPPAPTNGLPVVGNDSAQTHQGVAVDVNVLGNDSDPDGDSLSVVNLSGATGGTVSLLSNQRVRFTPAAGFSGPGSFTYRASDGKGTSSNAATVSVNVVPDPTIIPTGAGVHEGHSGTRTLHLPVRLSHASPKTVSVSWVTHADHNSPSTLPSSGHALSPADFQAASGTLTFSPGQTEKTIAITVRGDTVIEAGWEFVVIITSNPVNGSLGGFGGVGFGVILDDDAAPRPRI